MGLMEWLPSSKLELTVSHHQEVQQQFRVCHRHKDDDELLTFDYTGGDVER